jgi:hypothetical protein
VGFGTPVSRLSKDGLFVGYWDEGCHRAGTDQRWRRHARMEAPAGTHLWDERRQVLRYDLPNLRPCQLYLASRDKETTLDRILAFRAIRWVVVDSVKTIHVQGLITEAFTLKLYRQELERVSAKCSVDPPFASALGRNPADAWLVVRYTP